MLQTFAQKNMSTFVLWVVPSITIQPGVSSVPAGHDGTGSSPQPGISDTTPESTTPVDRPSLRNLETQTTIPFGHVDESDLQLAVSVKYKVPLWKCLFTDIVAHEVDVDALLPQACHWLEERQQHNDVDTCDPGMKAEVEKAIALRTLSDEKIELVRRAQKERDQKVNKIEVAADAMICQQFAKVRDLTPHGSDPEESPLFKTNQKNILVWKTGKIEIEEKAFQCVVGEQRKVDDDIADHVQSMIQSAFETYMQQQAASRPPGVDPALFGELESIMETEPNQVAWLNKQNPF